MKTISRLLAFIVLLLMPALLFAQEKTESIMRSNGRIYVVIAVIVAILAGLILYLVRLDRKISRLEKES